MIIAVCRTADVSWHQQVLQLAVLSFVIEVDIMPVVQIRLLGEDLIWCSHCGEVDNK